MRRVARLRTLGVLLVLLSTLAVAAQPASAETHLSETRRKLHAARARLINSKRSDAQLLAAIGRLGGQLNSTRARLASAEIALDRLAAQMAGEQRKLARLGDERQRRAAIVGRRARSMYILGPGMGADALLASDSMDEFVQRSSSLSYALRFDRALMEELARIADDSRKAEAALAGQQRAAQVVRRAIAEQAAIQAEVLQTRQVAESQLSSRISQYQDEVRALEAEQAHIIELIRSRQSRGSGRVSHRGFIWPVHGPITSPYGPRWGGFHTGIDIGCHEGTTIVAAKAGKVIAAEWGGGYGNMVIIDHGDGVSTLYAHNSHLYVEQGERVARGERISACGQTGHATGPHCHFEVRINGEHTDPRPFLP
jgi:murein DD-endopeptidase MepM/ murein hydrolase activator NlpD